VPYPRVAPLLWVKALDAHAELELVPFRRAVCHFAKAVYRLELIAQNCFHFRTSTPEAESEERDGRTVAREEIVEGVHAGGYVLRRRM